MLAGACERRAHAEATAIHRERQQHRLRPIARLRSNRNDPAARNEVGIVDELVGAGANADWAGLLTRLDIKYVLVAREVDWQAYGYLDRLPGLVRVGDYGSILLYRNPMLTST